MESLETSFNTTLKEKLKNIVLKEKAKVNSSTIKDEETQFKLILSTHNVNTESKDYKNLPRFYYCLPKHNEPLRQKLREEARSISLQKQSLQLLDNSELRVLWQLLEKYQTSADDLSISYSNFKKVSLLAGPKVQHYFTAQVFAGLQKGDPHKRVLVMSLFHYIMRKAWLVQTRVGLSLYDNTGQGYLRETEMDSYITELIPTLPQLEGLEESFHSFYVCTAVRKFMFFLDTLRTGQIRIFDILACSFLEDLLELRVEDQSKDVQEQNWFSAPSALRVYGHYLNLDCDHNGMLSISELASFGSGTLTQPFLKRVFQTCVTYNDEMDYKTYLDLVLALENRGEPQALAFLFRILDINSCNYLDAFTINYFFRAIEEQIRCLGAEMVEFEDFKTELFDMVKPKDPHRITLDDLIQSGKGETFVSILIEFHAFWNYESRESVSLDQSNEYFKKSECA